MAQSGPHPRRRPRILAGLRSRHEREAGGTVEDLIEDEWPNQGRFMLHVRSVTQHLAHDGVLTRAERDANVAAAGRSAPGGR